MVASPLRERADDEVVGVLDQVAHELVGHAAVERDRVPVALVQVVARTYRRIALAQGDRELRLALDADLSGVRSSALSANILPATLKTEVSGPNGKSSIAPGCSRHHARMSLASMCRIVAPGPIAADLDQAVAGSSMRRGSSVSRAMTSRWIC